MPDRVTTTTTRGPAPGTTGQGRNGRKLVPPRDKAKARRYYGLMGKAKQASSLAQRLYLLQRARALMEWVETTEERP